MGIVNQPKTVLEFFAGIGLMRAGLEQAGWKVIFANDIDPMKHRMYQHQFSDAPGHFVLDDIHNLKGADLPTATLATASFPCTDLSLAGRRAGLKGEQSSAFWGFVKVLEEMAERKPPLVLLENVYGFLNSNGGKDMEAALKALNKLGYATDLLLVDAAHFVPQSRVRLFIIGTLQPLASPSGLDTPSLLKPTDTRPDAVVNFIQAHPRIKWHLLKGLPALPPVLGNLPEILEDIPKRNKRVWWSNERVEYLLNQISDKHLEKLNELKGKAQYSYVTAFRRVRNGRSMAELRFDGIAGCLRTPKGGSARQILVEVGFGRVNVRLLSARECANLMGAVDFKLSGTETESLFGFGDAVCVSVVNWIADAYLSAHIERLENSNSPSQLRYAATA